jgi:hypothetical protein
MHGAAHLPVSSTTCDLGTRSGASLDNPAVIGDPAKAKDKTEWGLTRLR